MHAYLSKITIRYLVWFLSISFMALMESKAAPTSNWQKLKKGLYEENLALYRMSFPPSPKAVKKAPPGLLVCPLDQTNHLARRLAQRKVAYQRLHSLKGYTIQLYMGSSRAAALKAQDLMYNFPYPPKLYYRQPYYTVELGFFADRPEAYFVYLTLVRKVPTAMIRPCILPRMAYLAAMLHGVA